jgi:DHA1 family multidrug resistance protein-like MFS transporter
VLIAGITPAVQVAFALGLLQTGVAVGNSLGPLVGGLLSDFFGFRIAFFSTGIFLGLAGLIVLKWVDKDTQPRVEGNPKKLSLIPDVKPIASSPLLISLLFVTFGVQAANSVAYPMLPLFLKSLVLSVSSESSYIASTTGVILGVGAAFAALAAVLSGKLSTRIGYWTTLIFCLAAGALVTVLQTFVTNIPQLIVLRALSSFFIGGTMPVINAIIAVSSEKRHQGTIYGFNSSIAFVGAALGPMIGTAAAMLSYRAVFMASAIILGLSALETARRRKQNR